MLVMDVPPKDAERFEYETLEVYPCQLIVRIRLPKPPPIAAAANAVSVQAVRDVPKYPDIRHR